MSLLDELLPSEGEVINGRYRIVDRIGRGSFGVVYRAEMESLGSEVALKVLLPHIADEPRARQRFEQEIAIVRDLHHPNTIRVLDVARTSRGLPLYVMELLYGEPLSDAIEASGPLSERRVGHIARQILGALAEAHGRGVVHRDLKPANVMLCDIVGAPDFVKVLDFGIAKSADVGSTATQTGAVIGTPFYMSPEQASGRRDLDGRSDLYSLGILMAEALGAPPSASDLDPMEHLAVHLADEPLSFPTFLRGSALWPVIERATAKARAARYADAAEMRAALESVLAGASDLKPGPAPAPPVTAARQTDPALVDTFVAPASAERSPVTPALSSALRSSELSPPARPSVSGASVALAAVGIVALLAAAWWVKAVSSAPPALAGAVATAPDTDTPPVVAIAPAERLSAAPAVEAARAALVGAIPASRSVELDGPAGATVSVDGRALGVLPAVVSAPRLDVSVRLTVDADGDVVERDVLLSSSSWDLHRPEVTRASAGAVARPSRPPAQVPPPVRREAERAEQTDESPESGAAAAEPAGVPEPQPASGASPFGAAPIHD